MSPGKMTTKKIIITSILTILFSAAFAMAVHAILPASVDAGKFDSVLVMLWGFPVVASIYFLVLYTQCTLAVRFTCMTTETSNLQTGIRLGLCFALIYLLGMQEVMVESSPFTTYGGEFVKYQFFMGLGDAIPVFILCIVIALFTVKPDAGKTQVNNMKTSEKLYAISIIAVAFLLERTAGYETGIIQSASDTYPVSCYIWTALFGMMLGYIYTILYPVLWDENRWLQTPIRLILVVGLNWIIFNSFMGLIIKGTMAEVLVRSGLDVMVLFMAACILGRFIIKRPGQSMGEGDASDKASKHWHKVHGGQNVLAMAPHEVPTIIEAGNGFVISYQGINNQRNAK